MMDEDRRERSDRLSQRFDRDRDEDQGDDATEDDEEGAVDEMERNEDIEPPTEGSNETAESEASIKDRPSVLMYLPEDLQTELGIRFDELNARYKREHGRPLEKNRDYYPAVIEASLEGKAVEDVLDI
jgi:hypothetical protein